jgi:exopolyphosphatase/guanosine-5'-triphosphate,3'-diphosphate pyrophosphatase
MSGLDPLTPSWLISLDIGSQVLATRHFDEGLPRKRSVAACREEVAAAFAGVVAPQVDAALATGGTARALRRVVGSRTLGPEELDAALRRLMKRTPREASKAYGLDDGRGRTVLAGALLAIEAQQLLGVPFQVARGGIREGAALELSAGAVAA